MSLANFFSSTILMIYSKASIACLHGFIFLFLLNSRKKKKSERGIIILKINILYIYYTDTVFMQAKFIFAMYFKSN